MVGGLRCIYIPWICDDAFGMNEVTAFLEKRVMTSCFDERREVLGVS